MGCGQQAKLYCPGSTETVTSERALLTAEVARMVKEVAVSLAATVSNPVGEIEVPGF